jgi:RHS repeat-associated protein
VFSFSTLSDGTWVLPTSIEDRNGNILGVSNTSTATKIQFNIHDTLGRAILSASGFGSTGDTVSVSGLAAPYTLTWGTANSSFTSTATPINGTASDVDCHGILSGPGTIPVVTAIALPNGRQYQFSYDSTYGELSRITYPSGGYISYSWGLNPQSGFVAFADFSGARNACQYIYDKPALLHRYVSFDGVTIALQQDFGYSTTWNLPSSTPAWTSKQTTVTTHDLVRGKTFQTVYTYANSGAGSNDPLAFFQPMDDGIPVEQSVVYKDADGSTLRTVNKTWFNRDELQTAQTILDNGLSSKIAYTYGPGAQVTEEDEYDFGQTSPSRKTVTHYQSFPNSPLFPDLASLFDRPCQTIVYDSSGTRIAETDALYDQGTVVCGSAGTNSVAAVSNLPVGTHDETNYGPSSTAPRGNATSLTRKCLQNCTDAVTIYTYDETGQVLTAKDPNGNTTNYSYADNFDSNPALSTNAYLTQITHPPTNGVSHIQKSKYAYADGQPIQSTDENNQLTSYFYSDTFRRPTETDFPDGGKATISYNDAPPSPSVTTSRLMNSSNQFVTSTATMDGVGHVVKTLLTSDPDCATGDRNDTTYDGFGRVFTVSNPYCIAGESTSGLTTYTYDGLGRAMQVTHPDSTTALTTYTGRATQVQDEGNGIQRVTRISQTDGLGRLLSVCEVSSATLLGNGGTPGACNQDIAGTGFLTTYQYDALGNLLQVNQGTMRPRTFAYDSFSRLTSASNPESGTVSYSYDANGNVLTKTSPAPNQTGTATVTTTYQYDALNRLTQKSFSDGTTPAILYAYDVFNINFGCGGTSTNPVGRLTGSNNGWPYCYNYDPMGRLSFKYLRTPQNQIANFRYSYDFLGDTTYETGGLGAITYAYNTAGRLTSVTSSLSDTTHPPILLSGIHYNALGQITSETYGDSVAKTYSYSNRGFLRSLSAGTGTLPGTPGRGSVSISGAEQTKTITFVCGPFGRTCSATIPDTGTITVTVNGQPRSANWAATDSPATISANLASTLTGGSYVNATASGGVVTLTAKTGGSSTNYSLSVTVVDTSTQNFSQPSFAASASGPALTGGSGGGFQNSTYSLGLTFAPDGNILSGNDSVNGNWTYSYDAFNRLLGANQNGGAAVYSYDYDRYGNRWHQNGPHTMMLSFSANNNRMDSYSYDAAGNLLSDGTHTYTYDDENHVIKVDGGTTASYAYDPDGNRVQKTTAVGSFSEPAGTWIFLNDQSGRIVGQLNSPGNGYVRGEVFAGGRHLASYISGNTYFMHSDWLGTERLRTTFNSGLTESCTSLPFGDWLTCTGTDVSPLHFTGKERDSESGLDNFGARYDSSSMGRFMSVDPGDAGAALDAPQTWNAYSYVLNNPLNATDPSGLDCIYVYLDGSWNVVRGDCASDTDNGIFVDGRIVGNSVWVSKDSDGTVTGVSFLYNPNGTDVLLLHPEWNIATAGPRLSVWDSFKASLKGMEPFHDPTSNVEKGQQQATYLLGSLIGPIGDEEEAATLGLTRWGWKGAAKWRNAIRALAKPGTKLTLEGIVPTVEEASAMIKEAGGTIEREVEEHAPGGVSSHTYPHINYTTAEGQKATLRVQRLP